MTPLDLPHARQLCDAATPGPWFVSLEHGRISVYHELTPRSEEWVAGAKTEAIAAFLAAARTLLPQCLDRIEELEAREAIFDRDGVRLMEERDTALASAAEKQATIEALVVGFRRLFGNDTTARHDLFDVVECSLFSEPLSADVVLAALGEGEAP
jgi:hypothetical protein